MNRKSICLLGLLALVAMVFPSGLRADGFGITFSDTIGALTLFNPPFTLGWEFTLTNPIRVNDLAFYDDGQDGLADRHQLGIWDSNGNLLVSGTVLAGIASPLVDQWREVGVAPTDLGAGHYFIGALFLTGGDPVWFPSQTLTGFISTPGVTYDGATFAFGSTLADPTNPDGTPGFFGANFVFSAVPESSSFLLLGTGLVALMGMGLLKKGLV
jgi:hypothetical protein